MRWTNGAYEIDDERPRLDMDRIVAWLAESYWAGTQPETAVRRSWDAAGVTLGLYHNGEMIGCARALTDFTRFATCQTSTSSQSIVATVWAAGWCKPCSTTRMSHACAGSSTPLTPTISTANSASCPPTRR